MKLVVVSDIENESFLNEGSAFKWLALVEALEENER